RVIRSLHGADGGFWSNNGNGLLYKKRLRLLTTLADKGLDIPSILCHRWDIDTSINDKSVLDVIGGVVLRNKVVHATSKTKDEELRVNIFTMAQANLLFWIANGSSKRLASCNS
nr:hypothetical protein [Tanacetum cinerariifolium]